MVERKHRFDAFLREHLPFFIQKSVETVSPGEAYDHNWHIDCVGWHLEQCWKGNITRLIITLPPRHLKSICASVAFPAWVLGQDPTRRIICVSYAQDLANKLARDGRAIMESAWYRKAFKQTRISRRKNTEVEMETTKKGVRFGTSITGSLTGRGADFIIIDDPIKPGEAMSEVERERVNQWFSNTLYSRLNDKRDGVIILVMQRVHVDDLAGHLLEMDDWVQVDIPAIADEPMDYQIGDDEFRHREAGEVLHPSREDEETLAEIKEVVGSYVFEAQYQQRPVPPGGNMIRWDWFQTYEEPPTQRAFDLVVQSWDTAVKIGEEHDYSACTTWGLIDRKIYLLDVFRARLEYPDLRRQVMTQWDEYTANAVLMEDAGSGTLLIQDFRRNTDRRLIGIRPRGDKAVRMASATAMIEGGQVLIPKDRTDAPWLHDFQMEVLAFPCGRHDDQVDSMSQALRWIDIRKYRDRNGRPPRRDRQPRYRYQPISGLHYRRLA